MFLGPARESYLAQIIRPQEPASPLWGCAFWCSSWHLAITRLAKRLSTLFQTFQVYRGYGGLPPVFSLGRAQARRVGLTPASRRGALLFGGCAASGGSSAPGGCRLSTLEVHDGTCGASDVGHIADRISVCGEHGFDDLPACYFFVVCRLKRKLLCHVRAHACGEKASIGIVVAFSDLNYHLVEGGLPFRGICFGVCQRLNGFCIASAQDPYQAL